MLLIDNKLKNFFLIYLNWMINFLILFNKKFF